MNRVRQPPRTVAIVVPVSAQPQLLPEEELSIRHLCHFLGKYDKYLIAPSGSLIQREGFTVVQFPRKFFGSAAAHNRLLMWPSFYRVFQDYEYILMHHLDSLVLSDELMRWCRVGVDYIGAPWLPCDDSPWVKEPCVGNGGFTLMKVESVLQVLYNRYWQRPTSYWSDLVARNATHFRPIFRTLEVLQGRLRSKRLSRPLEYWRQNENPAGHGRNNDYFWSFDAARYLPTFKVATFEQGLRFAFEAAPRLCFQLNQHRLPFGCHAWAKFDRAFWEPYLLPAADASGAIERRQHSSKHVLT
jgi:hypothetical protein